MQILSNAEELFRELNNAIGQQISQASAYRKYGPGPREPVGKGGEGKPRAPTEPTAL